MHTFRKLPMTAPKSAATTMTGTSGRSVVTQSLVEENAGRDGDVERLRVRPERDGHPLGGRPGDAGAHPGALVPHDEGDRAGARARTGERETVGGRGPDRDSLLRRPDEKGVLVGRDRGQPERRAHAPAKHLRIREV